MTSFGKKELKILKKYNIPSRFHEEFKINAETLKKMKGKKRICLEELEDAAKKIIQKIEYSTYPQCSVYNKKVTRSGRVYSRTNIRLNTPCSLDALANTTAYQFALYYKNPKNPNLSRDAYLEFHGQCFDTHFIQSFTELRQR